MTANDVVPVLDLATAVRLAYRAIGEDNRGPDYVYQRDVCRYFEDDGTCSCIVGQIMSYVGVTLDVLKQYNDSSKIGCANEDGIHYLVHRIHPSLVILPEAREFLSKLQSMQDGSDSWGDALNHALDHMAWLAKNERVQAWAPSVSD